MSKFKFTYLNKVSQNEIESFIDKILNCEDIIDLDKEIFDNLLGFLKEYVEIITKININKLDEESQLIIKNIRKKLLNLQKDIYCSIKNKDDIIIGLILKFLEEIIDLFDDKEKKIVEKFINKNKSYKLDIIFKLNDKELKSIKDDKKLNKLIDEIYKNKKRRIGFALLDLFNNFYLEFFSKCLKGFIKKSVDSKCLIDVILKNMYINNKPLKSLENKFETKCCISKKILNNDNILKLYNNLFKTYPLNQNFIRNINNKEVKYFLEKKIIKEIIDIKISKYNIKITKILGINEKKEVESLYKVVKDLLDKNEDEIIKKLHKNKGYRERIVERLSKVIFYLVGIPKDNFFKEFYENDELIEKFYEILEKIVSSTKIKEKEKFIKLIKKLISWLKDLIILEGMDYIPIREINKKKFLSKHSKEVFIFKQVYEYLLNYYDEFLKTKVIDKNNILKAIEFCEIYNKHFDNQDTKIKFIIIRNILKTAINYYYVKYYIDIYKLLIEKFFEKI